MSTASDRVSAKSKGGAGPPSAAAKAGASGATTRTSMSRNTTSRRWPARSSRRRKACAHATVHVRRCRAFANLIVKWAAGGAGR